MDVPADKTNIYISDWNKKKLVKPEPDATTVTPETVMATGGAEMPF